MIKGLSNSNQILINELRQSKQISEQLLETQRALFLSILKQSNLRLLQISNDISLRRVIEEYEKDPIFRNVKKALKQKSADASKTNIWSYALKDIESKSRFPQLCILKESGLPVEGIVNELFSFTSRGVHTFFFDEVYINTKEYTEMQVEVAKALCDDMPIPYCTGTADALTTLFPEDDELEQ